jgi:hypothetical protein
VGKGKVAEVLSPGIAHTPTLCYNIVANLMFKWGGYNIVANLMFKWGGVGIGSSAYALLLEVVYDTISLQNYKVSMLIHKQNKSTVL